MLIIICLCIMALLNKTCPCHVGGPYKFMEKDMGFLIFITVYVVSVSIVNSQITYNNTDLMLNRTKRYHELPTAEVKRLKKNSTVPLKSYLIENKALTPKVPVIKPRLMNLRLDNGVNTIPRNIVQLKKQPRNNFVPTNSLIPLNTYKLETRTGEHNKPANTEKITDNYEENIIKKQHDHGENVLIPKHDFFEDDIDYDEINRMDELKKPVNHNHFTVNTVKHLDADKVQKNNPSSETRKIGISDNSGHDPNMNTNVHHDAGNVIDNITCIENKIKAIPVIPNIPIKTKVESKIPKCNKTINNLSVLVPKNGTIKPHQQNENKKEVNIDIEDAAQNSVKGLYNTPNCTETEDIVLAIISNVNDEENTIDAITEPLVNAATPLKNIKSESTDNIVIKNHTFEEVRERSKMSSPDIFNQDQSQELWKTPQNWYNGEWNPYYYYDPYQNANYLTNDDSIPKPDYIHTDPPYEHPYEDTINLNDVMDREPDNYEIPNKMPDYKDRVWRKWKDIEICIKTSKSNPASVEVEQKPINADDKVVNNGFKSPIFNGFSHGVIDCNKNHNVASWYPCCSYPSYRYVY